MNLKLKIKLGEIMTAKKRATPVKPVLRNYIVMALDTSISMRHIIQDAFNMCNNIIGTTKTNAKEKDQQVYLNVTTFDSSVRPGVLQDINYVQTITFNGHMGNSTALLDATGKGIEILRENEFPEPNVDKSFLLIVITDGEENSSINYSNKNKLRKLLDEVNNRDDYTVAFQVPRGAAQNLSQQFKIPIDNIREWETTRVGVQETQCVTTDAITSYMSNRSVGQKMSKTFFKDVTTDLSGVTQKSLNKTLTDRSNEFKTYLVEKEIDIKTFVEEKTGKPYVTGSVYYELMKKEKVQPGKAVVLMDKTKKKLWGGQEARDLIGLPNGLDAKVEPGNHANYNIYVQSTSNNRKLVRGTKVLVHKATAGV